MAGGSKSLLPNVMMHDSRLMSMLRYCMCRMEEVNNPDVKNVGTGTGVKVQNKGYRTGTRTIECCSISISVCCTSLHSLSTTSSTPLRHCINKHTSEKGVGVGGRPI